MNSISIDPGDRLYKLFDVTESTDDFQWIFISEHALTQIINGHSTLDSRVVERLTTDRSSRLIVSSILEIVGPEYPLKCKTLFESLNITLQQIHIVVATEPQQQMFKTAVSEFKVSVFNYWEYITPFVVRSWPFQRSNALPQKRFLYINRRCSPDRALIFYKLWKDLEFQNNSHASMHKGAYWDRKINEEQHFQNCMNGLKHLPYFEKIKKFYNRITLPVLQNNQEAYDYDFFGDRNNQLLSFYKNSSVSVIVESHPNHPAAAFMPTEKLYRSLATGQPFVVFGVQHYYRNLQAQGYKFSSIPKFDGVEDLCTRAEQFADHVKKLARSSETDWNRFLSRELVYAKHNLKVLKQRKHQRSQQFHPELSQWLKPAPGRI
jgi:hypothetical protein